MEGGGEREEGGRDTMMGNETFIGFQPLEITTLTGKLSLELVVK